MAILEMVKPYLHAHYITNVLIASLYFILKKVPGICDKLFETCKLELREWEYLTFLGCLIVLKNRKQVSMAGYLSTACLFAKALNLMLFLHHSLAFAVIYFFIGLLHFIMVPMPVHPGPEKIVYFRGPNLEEELQRDARVTWVLAFYVAWSPACLTLAPIFSDISAEYTLDNLRFGKMDVSRYPKVLFLVQDKPFENTISVLHTDLFYLLWFNIDCSTWSKQLPTVILFQGGKEKTRRPASSRNMTIKFTFTKENMIRALELNDVYSQCKRQPIGGRRSVYECVADDKLKKVV